MRKTINPQPSLREPWLELEHARELEAISSVLDAHPKINELVLQELRASNPSARHDVGCGGMSAEQVLRAAVIKQMNQFTYRELAFHLADSRSYRTFCRLGIAEPTPSKSTLAANIKALGFETLEKINRELVHIAKSAGIAKKSASGLHGSGNEYSSTFRLRASLRLCSSSNPFDVPSSRLAGCSSSLRQSNASREKTSPGNPQREG